MNKWLILLLSAAIMQIGYSQSSDGRYQMPLEDVLKKIEKQYNVHIKYNPEQVEGQKVDYALWRFRADVDRTLQEVLSPLDMKVNKEGEGQYKLKEYEYYRWQVKDGWEYLDLLSSQYTNRAEWEVRQQAIRAELLGALELSPLPALPSSQILLTEKRAYTGYTVENFALEILPGVYVNGSIYKPGRLNHTAPLMMSPDGHWAGHRYREDAQIRAAMLAKLGVVTVSYDLFAWGESLLQFAAEDHRRSLSISVQTLGAIRILDYMLQQTFVDSKRVGICGGSGGGSHAVLMSALDPRITMSIPVVSLSSYFYGGCPCESGMPIHAVAGGTNNVEFAAMAAPNPQLIISDGKDWTAHMPEHDFPYLQKIYGYYGMSGNVHNVHLAQDGHDFGYSKRKPVYDFVIKHFSLSAEGLRNANGDYKESECVIEPAEMMYAFGSHGERLPANAIHGYENLEKIFQK